MRYVLSNLKAYTVNQRSPTWCVSRYQVARTDRMVGPRTFS